MSEREKPLGENIWAGMTSSSELQSHTSDEIRRTLLGDEEYGRLENMLRAPQWKYRIVGVDTFDGTDWVIDDVDSFEEAQKIASSNGGSMLKTHVYDDTWGHVFDAGTF